MMAKERTLREKDIERQLAIASHRSGGLALKFTSPGMAGVPDRILLMPSGRAAFVEVKAPGKRLRPLQKKRKQQLEALGFRVFVIDLPDQIGGVLDELSAP